MDAAPPIQASPPPVPASTTSPPAPTLSLRWPSEQWLPTVSAVWPRSAQLATAFLLGLAVALLGIQLWSMSRCSTRPLELDRAKGISYRIDLNSAQPEQLLQVPGVGEKTADKIEKYREEHGPFQSKKELTQIPGIGPAKYEKMNDWLTTGAEEKVVVDTSTISQKAGSPAGTRAKSTSPRKPSKKEENIKEKIDVNNADLEELQKLPGIGPKLAQRIVDERAKSPFRNVEDLRRVSGIGPKILERLKPFVFISSASKRVASGASTSK